MFLVYECFIELVEEYDDGDNSQDALEEPRFHDDSRLVDAFFLEEMMKRCNEEQLFLEVFFPEDLQKAGGQIHDEESEENQEWDENARSHVDEIDQ